MRPHLCLRLARQSVSSSRCTARKYCIFNRFGSSPWLRRRPSDFLSLREARTLSSGSGAQGISRFADFSPIDQRQSPFKQHRQNELRQDQESETPLYKDRYPRLASSSMRKSIPEFLEDFQKQGPSEEVMLTGRVRSKRVAGRSLIFLDIVNEFQKMQVMVNKSKCVSEEQRRLQKFALFRNLIQVGDHICRISSSSLLSLAPPTSG